MLDRSWSYIWCWLKYIYTSATLDCWKLSFHSYYRLTYIILSIHSICMFLFTRRWLDYWLDYYDLDSCDASFCRFSRATVLVKVRKSFLLRYCIIFRRLATRIWKLLVDPLSFLFAVKCLVMLRILSVMTAIWTEDDPVSSLCICTSCIFWAILNFCISFWFAVASENVCMTSFELEGLSTGNRYSSVPTVLK